MSHNHNCNCNCNGYPEYPNPPCPPPAPRGFLRIEGSDSPTGPATGGSVTIPIGSTIRFWRTEGGIQVTEGSAMVNIKSTPVGFCTVGSTAAPVSAQYPDIGTAIAAGCTYIFVISSITEPATSININTEIYLEIFAGVTVTSTQLDQFKLNNHTLTVAGHGNINWNLTGVPGTGAFFSGFGNLIVRDINFIIVYAGPFQSFNGNSTLDIDGLNITTGQAEGTGLIVTAGSNRIVNTNINVPIGTAGYNLLVMSGGYTQIDNVKIIGSPSNIANQYVLLAAPASTVQVNNLLLDSNTGSPDVPTFFFGGMATLSNISYVGNGLNIQLTSFNNNTTLNNIICTSLSDSILYGPISDVNINNLLTNTISTTNPINNSVFSNSNIDTFTLEGNNNNVSSSNINTLSVNGDNNNIVGNIVVNKITVSAGTKNNISDNILTGVGSKIKIDAGASNTSVVGNNTFSTAISDAGTATFGVSVPTTPAGYSVKLNND